VTLDKIEVTLEHEAPSAGCNDANLVAGLESGLPESLHGNRRLMLRADPSEPSASFLYFLHRK